MHQISKLFLEEVLLQKVESYTISPGSNPGDNVQSRLLAIYVKTHNGTTVHLIHKSLHSKSPYSLWFFKNEITFYNCVRPQLDAIHPQAIPKYFQGASDGENDFLCMEDLRPQGYIMKDKFLGLPFAEAALVMKEVATFHATSYHLVRLEGEQIFDRLPENTFANNWLFSHRGLRGGPIWFPELYQTAIDILASRSSSIDLANAMKKIEKNDVFQISTAVARKTDKNYFPLIIHGDLWMNNILFKYDKEGKPISIKLLDFQHARRGNIIEELLYLIFTSTTPTTRKSHLLHLLTIYYNSFHSKLDEIGCPLPIGFSKGNLIDSIYKEMMTPFVYLTFALPMQLNETSPPPADQEKKDTENEANSTESPKNENPDQSFLNRMRYSFENSPRAIDRFEDVTREMVELKVLPSVM